MDLPSPSSDTYPKGAKQGTWKATSEIKTCEAKVGTCFDYDRLRRRRRRLVVVVLLSLARFGRTFGTTGSGLSVVRPDLMRRSSSASMAGSVLGGV